MRPRLPIPDSCYQSTIESSARLVDNWRESYKLLLQYGPPEVVGSAPDNINDSIVEDSKLKWLFRNFASFSSGYKYIKKHNASYLRIWKGGNNFIRRNIEHFMGEGSKDMKAMDGDRLENSKCIFTFIRDPIQHFLSGYNEFEFRTLKHDINMEEQCPKCSYIHFPTGSENRFWAFLYDLLSFNILRCNSQRCDLSHESIKHFFPMSGVLRYGPRIDFLGRTETMEDDWYKLQEECFGLAPDQVIDADTSLGQHYSSKDPYSVYGPAKKVVKENLHVEKILKNILAEDYLCFFGTYDLQ